MLWNGNERTARGQVDREVALQPRFRPSDHDGNGGCSCVHWRRCRWLAAADHGV